MSRASSNAIRCSSAPRRAERCAGPGAIATRRTRRPRAGETPAPATGSAKSWKPAARAIEERLGTDLDNVFPDERRRRRRAAGPDGARPPIRNGSSVGNGGREDGDYNLEAFVSAETTLADHLAEQLALAISDPVRRHDRPIPDRSGRRGRLPRRRSRDGRRKTRRAARRGRSGAAIAADLRSAGRVRAQSHRMPGDPAQGARPLRSGDAGAGRPSRSARQARSRGAARASAASATRISPT